MHLLIQLSTFYFAQSLQYYRNDYQPNTNEKREIQLLVFAENEHREDDAVNGFEVVGQIDGEGGNFLKHNDLQEAKSDGANDHHKSQIRIIHADGIKSPDRDELIIQGYEAGQADEAADHLPKQHVLRFIMLANPLIGNGKQRIQG